MKTIWKFPLVSQVALLAREVVVEMPAGAAVLTAQLQAGIPCAWALVDPAAPLTRRRFRILGTGHELSESEAHALSYVSTLQLSSVLVLHVFEETP